MLRGFRTAGARWRHTRAYTATPNIDALSLDDWSMMFKAATVDLAAMDVDTISYRESAQRMRDLLKTQLLKHSDIHERPERFFEAHRLLAAHSVKLGPGFWIRFTVHYNLCAGTVMAIGNDEQVAALKEMQDDGLLGCFSLTEKLAGVSSGLVVNTTADWDPASQTFLIKSPTPGATKNWISQGLVADKTVVIADLRINGKSYGPHGFFINLREAGEVVPGVVHGDMGKKTVGNDLDNAWIAFDNVRVPKDALLNRYADIVNDEYVQKEKGLPVFHMIGQRLFTGRVAVAQAALEFRRSLFEKTKKFTDGKECWDPKGSVKLSDIPQLKRLFERNEERLDLLDAFVGRVERELCGCLKAGKPPSIRLVEAIAAAKVLCVEDSIEMVHALKNEVGSYALMYGSGFEQADFLTCCKFAEGDSRILMQKMARDLVRQHAKDPSSVDPTRTAELELLHTLKSDPTNFDATYGLAHAIVNRIVKEFTDN
eukprot:TRINITY_DN4600_c0_g2_i1.p1 TRINITY_DN4600_c0_g2~~TRINITY_DN4600_c0_g2_i1.p1  ORF type:complete len:502 (+),score=124.56 TRINITY_DN4600_c0_g2_i1:57-1508(+)